MYVEAISFHYDGIHDNILHDNILHSSMLHQDFWRSWRPDWLIIMKKCNREDREGESEVMQTLFKIQCQDRQEAPAVSGWTVWWTPSGLSSAPSSSQSSHKIVMLYSPHYQLWRPPTFINQLYIIWLVRSFHKNWPLHTSLPLQLMALLCSLGFSFPCNFNTTAAAAQY